VPLAPVIRNAESQEFAEAQIAPLEKAKADEEAYMLSYIYAFWLTAWVSLTEFC
jgi:hypothetical protein